MIKIGNVVAEESVTRESFIKIIKGLNLKTPLIIKPNWGFSVCFTEAMILDWILSTIEGKILVVESYGWARTEEALNTEKWGSFEQEELRKSDRWFLEYSGVGKILKKHDVEFMNITEENWGQNTVNPDIIRSIVEEKHTPLEREDFYGFVPEKLYEMRGCDLLSLAKIRLLEEPMKVSFAVKNFFGMIPGPNRGKYHGKKHSLLNQSIVDIYKVYDSLFHISGVVEAVITASLRDPDTLNWETRENPSFTSASNDPLELDASVAALLGINPHNVGYLRLAAETFGKWDEENITRCMNSDIKII
ncbi:MAG: DUF362 domain-containing protein [Candidatus Hodarchaeales archaeon]|jgi:uncharacterized protein (DUF362 family)